MNESRVAKPNTVAGSTSQSGDCPGTIITQGGRETMTLPNATTPPITSPADISGFLTLTQASKRIPRMNGHRVHVSTLWRWCRKGYNGICLEYVRVGRTIMVTEEGLNRFFVALAQADKATEPSNTTGRKRKPRQINSEARQEAINDANEILRRAKIIV